MAMIKCKECKSEISDKAKACPNCGAPVPKKTSPVTWFALISIILMLVFGLPQPENKHSATSKTTTHSNANKSNDESKQIAWIDKGKESVKERLKDPSSAKFRNVYFNRGKDNIPMTCGEVNSKNSFGGYSGYIKFISAGSSKNTFLETDVKDFHNLWNQFCTK